MKITVYNPNKYEPTEPGENAEAAGTETKAEAVADAVESPAVAEAPSEVESPAVEPAAETGPPGGETLPATESFAGAADAAKEVPLTWGDQAIQQSAGTCIPKPDYVIAHEKEVEELKNEFVLAAQRKSDLENELKAAKKEEREALKHYTQMLTRGPIKPAEPKTDTATTPGGNPSESPTAPTTQAAEPNAVQSDAWRAASINELTTLSEKLREKLIEAGADTIGTLEDLRAQIAEGKANWPKGIGAAKITQIEDAVIDWLTANRDSYAFQTVPASSENSIDTSNNTPNEATEEWISTETWAMMPAAEKSAYLTARVRAIRGDDGNPEWAKPAVEGANYFDDGEQEFWATKAAGVEPPTLENFIATAACPWHPCDAQDDWLRGFASAFDVWAAEKEALGEDEVGAEVEGEGDTEANEPVAVAAVPQTAKGWESF